MADHILSMMMVMMVHVDGDDDDLGPEMLVVEEAAGNSSLTVVWLKNYLLYIPRSFVFLWTLWIDNHARNKIVVLAAAVVLATIVLILHSRERSVQHTFECREVNRLVVLN